MSRRTFIPLTGFFFEVSAYRNMEMEDVPRFGLERAPAIAMARRCCDISANSSIVSVFDLNGSK
jgi:hypothetical protein